MLVPSRRVWDELLSSGGGLWFEPVVGPEQYALVVKMPATAIKCAYLGSRVSLIVATVDGDGKRIRVVALRVKPLNDSSYLVFGVQREQRHFRLLDRFLHDRRAAIHFFDETSVPAHAATCLLSEDGATRIISEIKPTLPHYQGSGGPFGDHALDVVEADANRENADERRSSLWVEAELVLVDHATFRVAVAGVGESALTSTDEGGGQEVMILRVMDALFPGAAYMNPRYGQPGMTKELTDILGVGSDCLFLVESKAIGILGTGEAQESRRRGATVWKEIRKATKQLVGAIRTIRRGGPLQEKEGKPLTIPSASLKHLFAVIVVSDMHPDVPWEAVAKTIVGASGSTRAFFNVIDVGELERLVVYTRRSVGGVANNLLLRLNAVIDSKTALVRGGLAPGTFPYGE